MTQSCCRYERRAGWTSRLLSAILWCSIPGCSGIPGIETESFEVSEVATGEPVADAMVHFRFVYPNGDSSGTNTLSTNSNGRFAVCLFVRYVGAPGPASATVDHESWRITIEKDGVSDEIVLMRDEALPHCTAEFVIPRCFSVGEEGSRFRVHLKSQILGTCSR